MVCSAGGILLWLHQEGQAEREFSTIREEDEFDLLALYEKNPDLIGWIKIKDTKIDYPVMRGEKYLYRNFKKEYSDSGTPFVSDEWDAEDVNSLVFGHNMWVQKTMFNPLHKYEKKEYWSDHQTGIFYVIRKDFRGRVYVEQRDFTISHVVQTSVNSEFSWPSCVGQRDEFELLEYMDWCDGNEMYDTDVADLQGNGTVTLCTCSYHIKGHRKEGRLLVVGTITKTGVYQ